MRLKTPVPAAVVAELGALALVACGGGGSPEETVSTFIDAMAEGDGEEACAQLTEEGQETAVDSVAGTAAEGVSCEETVANIPEEAKSALEEAEVSTTEESDTEATVEVAVSGQTGSLALVKEGDDWRINGPAIADVEI